MNFFIKENNIWNKVDLKNKILFESPIITVPETATLLLHGDSLIDSSLFEVPIINHGVIIDNSKTKFPGSSLYFNGSSYLEIQKDDYVNGKKDFTIEAWIYRELTFSNGAIFHQDATPGSGYGFLTGYYSGDTPYLYVASVNNSWNIVGGVAHGTHPPGQWIHHAVVRSGDTFYTFNNGILTYNTTVTNAQIAGSGNCYIGRYNYSGGQSQFRGWMQEICISNIAKWTSNFTPPVEPY